MINRLRVLSWGSILIGLAYGIAVLPIQPMDRMVWLGLAVALAYLVVAARTTHATAEMAQTSDDSSVFALWRTAFRATFLHRALLIIPMFSLMMAAQEFFLRAPISCSGTFRAFCSMNWSGSGIQAEAMLLATGILGVFMLLDHGLLIALTLLTHKHLPKSSVFVGNTAIGLRFALACAVMTVVAGSLQMMEITRNTNAYNAETLTERRIQETVYPAFEPVVTGGILVSSTIMNRTSYCLQHDPYVPNNCISSYDTRPFIARQMVSAFLSMLMYGLLIIGVLRLTAPFSLQLSVAHAKAKRTPLEVDADITYF